MVGGLYFYIDLGKLSLYKYWTFKNKRTFFQKKKKN